MAELVLTEMDEVVLHQLTERATRHGRTLAQEAKEILVGAVRCQPPDSWAAVDEIYLRLANSGQTYSDSADLLREDRDR